MDDHSTGIEAMSTCFNEGWLSEVLYEVKSGKEATVYCCRGGKLAPDQLVAAKVYRPLVSRSFKNDAIYQTGRVHLARENRVSRAIKAGSDFGREVQMALWLEHEWETLNHLHKTGCDVPRPLHRAGHVILMRYYGDDQSPAPLLQQIEPTLDQTEALLGQLLDNVAWMLNAHIVHGDLSHYNVIVQDERAVMIDFPQAVDPRLNPAARMILERDVSNICAWAGRHGLDCDANEFVNDLWEAFTEGRIG